MSRSVNSKSSDSGPVNPFRPELLDEVQGPSYGTDSSLDMLEASMDEVEAFSGLSFDVFDEVAVEDLPEGVPAATRNEKYTAPLIGSVYDSTVLVADPELLSMPEAERNHALLHENVHGHYFNDKEERPLERAGIEGEDKEKLYQLLNYGDESAFEGATEFITHLLDPESRKVGKKFYPEEMEAVEEELDADSDLVEDIRGLKNDLIDNYREVYDVEAFDGVYMESGNFAGVDYDALVIGEDAEAYGEEVVRGYLENFSEYDEDGVYGLDEDSGGVAEDNSINWSGWDEKLDYTEGM